MAMILDDQLTSDAIGEEFPNDILDPVTFALQTPFVSKPINRTPSTSKSVAVLPKTPRLNGSGQRLSIGSHCDAQESVDMFCSTPVTEPGTQIPLENTPKLDMKSFLKKFKRTYSMDLKRETVGPVVEEPQSLQIKNYGDTLGDSQNSIFNIEKSDTVPGMDGYVLETAKPASVLMDDIEEVQSLYEHEHLKVH